MYIMNVTWMRMCSSISMTGRTWMLSVVTAATAHQANRPPPRHSAN